MAKPQFKTKGPLRDGRTTRRIEQVLAQPEPERRSFIERMREQSSEWDEILALFEDEDPAFEGFLEHGPQLSIPLPEEQQNRVPLNRPIGDYVPTKIIGAGAFATVYRARQLSLEREIALKVSTNSGREAQILAHLEHDNIVKVYTETVLADRNLRLICMQYIEGATLGELISHFVSTPGARRHGSTIVSYLMSVSRSSTTSTGGNLPDASARLGSLDYVESALWVGSQLARALAYAHQKGTLHLDIKPNNILLNRYGKPFLSDFNVSITSRQLRSGEVDRLGGTADYMAPEHADIFRSRDIEQAARKIDNRADIYSLGVVIREFISAASPDATIRFRRPSATTLVQEDVSHAADADNAWDARHLVDLGVRAALFKCTSEDREKRFDSAMHLAQAFEACLEIRDIAKRLPHAGILALLGKRWPRMALLLLALSPALFASTVGFSYLAPFFPTAGDRLLENMLFFHAVIYILLFLALDHSAKMVVGPLSSALDLENIERTAAEARAGLIAFPGRVFLCLTLLWLPATIAFAAWRCCVGGALDTPVFAQALILFGLGGLCACGYSASLISLFSLHLIYPRLWAGSASISEQCSIELGGVEGRMRLYCTLVVFCPLLFAGLSLLDAPGLARFGRPPNIAIPILLALAGGIVAFSFATRLSRVVYAFVGKTATTRRL